jgi:hypothetical protein
MKKNAIAKARTFSGKVSLMVRYAALAAADRRDREQGSGAP